MANTFDQLREQIYDRFPDNNEGLITAKAQRDMLFDFVDVMEEMARPRGWKRWLSGYMVGRLGAALEERFQLVDLCRQAVTSPKGFGKRLGGREHRIPSQRANPQLSHSFRHGG